MTFPYLEAIPYRQKMLARVNQVNNYAKYSSPSRKGSGAVRAQRVETRMAMARTASMRLPCTSLV